MTLATAEDEARSKNFGEPITVGNLFSGIGGWSTGFKQYTMNKDLFDIRWAIDIWDGACGVHMHNHPDIPIICENIMNINPDEIEPVDVIVASLPYPVTRPFTKKVEEFVNKIPTVKVWIMTNIVTKDNIPEGETIDDFLIGANHYGLAHTGIYRIRGNIERPSSKIIPNPLTLGNIIHSLGIPGEEPLTLVYSPFSETEYILGEEANRHDLIKIDIHNINQLFKDRILVKEPIHFPDDLERPARAPWNEPTIIVDYRFDRPVLRYLSLRELTILQGFPANYKLTVESRRKMETMLINTIPPPIVRALSFQIWKKIRKLD
jgi:hypothetical protein